MPPAKKTSNVDASEQMKQALRWVVRNRFWLILGLSALLPFIGYAVGSGPINEATKKKADEIKGADTAVGPFTSPNIPNDQWKPIVDEKKEVLTKDVNKAWARLYEVQAPLLKWPDVVESQFHAWGRKWPENVDLGAVQKAIDDYVNAYEKEVDATYKKVNPWDYETGKGVVVVPDKTVLLHPSTFDPANPPSLNKVWSAQERLWIQATLLDAIAKINGKAKGWDDAVVKQINLIEVGSALAQDQKSLVEGKTVKAAEEIVAPGGTSAPAAESAANGRHGPSRMMMMGGAGGGRAGRHRGRLPPQDLTSTQFTVVPVSMTVLVDQNRLQEFLVGLENSPMAIQILEFEMVKPPNPVTKPEKGQAPAGSMMMGGSMMGGSMMDPARMAGRMMMAPGTAGRDAGGMMDPARMAGRMMPGGMMGDMGGSGAASKKGIDVRTKKAKEEREAREKKRKALGRAVDTYYDLVEVTVYGQARFYNPPPPPPAEPASPGDAADAAKTDATKADAAKTDATKADAAKKDEPKKADEAKKDESKKDEAKAGETKADEASKKEESKKEEAKPAEAPKADEPKGAAAKPAEAPAKAEAPKAEAPAKAEAAPKADEPAKPAAAPKS